MPLGVEPGDPMAAALTPRTDDVMRGAAQPRDHLAGPAAGPAGRGVVADAHRPPTIASGRSGGGAAQARAAARIPATGAGRSVNRSKLNAPCPTRISSPSTVSLPAARAASV